MSVGRCEICRMSKDDPDFEWYMDKHEERQCRVRARHIITDMARLLLELEWSGILYSGPDFNCCPVCENVEGELHAADCEWLRVAKKAGLR